MKTKPRTPNAKTSTVTRDDIDDRLARAQALAHVLADAAGGDLGVESDNVHQVGLVIADEIKQAKKLLERYKGEAELPRNAREAA